VVGASATRLGASERSLAWEQILPELAGEAGVLASRYSLDPGAIAEVALDVRSAAVLHGREPAMDDVARSVRSRGAVALAQGVELRRPVASFADLVLPPERLEQLRDATGRLVHQQRVLEEWGFLRGRAGARGVRMLFAGPPGTGKTLSAEVMATSLGVDLLVVDISRVVSKWVGETEKNLATVFDVAERAQAVLLFDEADALFGKRTEVSDAHDRYANLETAYLLTRLERFEGLAVLATNLRQNVDPAFLRRIEFLVEFGEPGPREREDLWRRHLPKDAPLDGDVDLAEIASVYPVVGGFIRNAAVAAAFLAAGDGRAIGRTDLVKAIRREYEKAGKTFPGVSAGVSAHHGGDKWP
jgi:SpoVK/Ycf46/Vps4 family AAA+-type ATPase